MTKEIPPEIQALLKQVVDHFDKEDVAVRERQIRTWRRLKLMWEGFYQTWYSETAHDWRIWDDAEASGDDGQQGYYDKPINVFRAYLESIIAALSVTVPPVKCYPDDADNTLDLSTARTGDKIAQLVYRHNNVSLLWLHALFIYCTEGMVACYSYPKEDEKFGTYEKKEHEEESEEHQYAKCPECGFTLTDSILQQTDPARAAAMQAQEELKQDEFMPYEDTAGYEDFGSELCPACQAIMTPEITQESVIVTRLVGVTQEPKTRMCLEAYGGLYVKVPVYARKQEECPYLFYMYETHYANAVERYAHLHGKKGLTAKKISSAMGPRDPYEEWGRLSPQYQGEYPTNVVTVRNCWLRPSSFNVLQDKDEVEKLKKKYPKGCKVVFVGDEFAEACTESLDDCWTLTYNPLSDYLHHDPLGLLLVSIQEITNDLISLTLQTVEHGIGQTFADPGVLDFNAYRQTESIPGGIYEAKPKSGQALNQAFHEVKTATLSPEVMPFASNIQSLAQLVSGALPSLFGGMTEAGSGTASEYSMSRAQALQRLQNVWKMLTSWWKEIFGKVIPMYIQETQDQGDDRDVQRDTNGNFINVFLRRAEMEGKIGKVELEANENLPLTWSQQKDIIMQLLQAANPQILEIIGSPENLPIIRQAIGLTDFFIPGEDSREKQLDEIKLLLDSEPIPTGDMMMPEMPSIEVDPDYDVHPIEFSTVQNWANSEAGRQAKLDNPKGYKNALLHGKMHLMMMQQQALTAPATPEDDGAQTHGDADITEKEAPITGEENVATVQ